MPGYKWCGKPREGINCKRGEGGVGFLVCESLTDDITNVKEVKCNETIWLSITIKKEVDLYIKCVHMPTQGNIKHICTHRF